MVDSKKIIKGVPMKSFKNKRSGFALFSFLLLNLFFDTAIIFMLFNISMNLFVIFTLNVFVVGAAAFTLALLGQFFSSLRLSMPSISLLNYLPKQWLVALVEKITGYSANPDDINSYNFLIWLAAYSSPAHLSLHFFEELNVRGSQVARQMVRSGQPVSKVRKFYNHPVKPEPAKYPDPPTDLGSYAPDLGSYDPREEVPSASSYRETRMEEVLDRDEQEQDRISVSSSISYNIPTEEDVDRDEQEQGPISVSGSTPYELDADDQIQQIMRYLALNSPGASLNFEDIFSSSEIAQSFMAQLSYDERPQDQDRIEEISEPDLAADLNSLIRMQEDVVSSSRSVSNSHLQIVEDRESVTGPSSHASIEEISAPVSRDDLNSFHQELSTICRDLAKDEDERQAVDNMLTEITRLNVQMSELQCEDALKESMRKFNPVERNLILRVLNGRTFGLLLPRLLQFVNQVRALELGDRVKEILGLYQEVDDLNRVQSREEGPQTILTPKQIKILHHLFELKSKGSDMTFINQLTVFPISDGMFSEKLDRAISILGEKNCMVYASKSLLDTLCELGEAQIEEVTDFSDAQKRMLICHFENYNAFVDIEDKEKCESVISWVKEQQELSPGYLKLDQLNAFDLSVVREKIRNLHIRSFWHIMNYISHFMDKIQSQHIVSLFGMSFRKRYMLLSNRLDVDFIDVIKSHELSPRVIESYHLESFETFLFSSNPDEVEDRGLRNQLQTLIERNREDGETAHFHEFGELGGGNVYRLFEAEYSKARYSEYSSISDEDIERVWGEASTLLLRHDFETQDLRQRETLRSYAALRLIRCFAKNDDALGLALPDHQRYWRADSSMSDNFEKAKKAVVFLWKLSENYETISSESAPEFADNFKKSIIEYMSKDIDTCPNQLMNSIWNLGMPYFFSDVTRAVSSGQVIEGIRASGLDFRDQLRAEEPSRPEAFDGQIVRQKTILSEPEFQRFTREMIRAIGLHVDQPSDKPAIAKQKVEYIERKAEDYITTLANSYQQNRGRAHL